LLTLFTRKINIPGFPKLNVIGSIENITYNLTKIKNHEIWNNPQVSFQSVFNLKNQNDKLMESLIEHNQFNKDNIFQENELYSNMQKFDDLLDEILGTDDTPEFPLILDKYFKLFWGDKKLIKTSLKMDSKKNTKRRMLNNIFEYKLR